MQARYRWYRIQLPRAAPELAVVIETHTLSHEANQGFTRVNGTLGQLIHRFLWRSKVVITQFDGNGEPIFQQVPTVNFTDFAILNIDETVFLRIENPGRSVKYLLNALESIVGLGFTCEPVLFDRKKPTTVFKYIEVNKLIGLKVTEAILGEDLVASMEFSSKEGINPEKLTVLSDVHHKIDSVSYELIYGGQRGLLSFNSNGTMKVSGQIVPRLIHLIEQDLANISRTTL